jgi:uncharacterized protein (TIGR00255 family)
MTGFGRAEAERDGRILVAEARSVNHRFLELSIRLPRSLQPFENRLRNRIQEQIVRGKANISVSWKGPGENGATLSVDNDLARQYVEILQDIRGAFGFREPVTLGQLMALPDLIKWTEPETDPEAGWEQLAEATDNAIGDLIVMRQSEGKAMAKDLRGRIQTLRDCLKAVEKRAPDRLTEARERLRTRVGELLKGEAQIDEERLVLEASFQAERMDCTEECVRLRSHLDQLEELLAGGGAVGRKLNFLTQELNREANTIGSKANDVAIAREVIQLKEEIEIIREQIQNIE